MQPLLPRRVVTADAREPVGIRQLSAVQEPLNFDAESTDNRSVPGMLRRGFVVGAVLSLVAALGFALYPFEAQTGAGAEGSRTCIPVVEAHRSGPPRPSSADMNLVFSTGIPTPAQARDPQYRANVAAVANSASAARINAWNDWILGAGACVTRSKHRVAEAEAALGVAVLLALGAVIVKQLGRSEVLSIR
jgi:hypothetical protein